MNNIRLFVREIIFCLYHLFSVKVPRIYFRQKAARALRKARLPMIRLVDLTGTKFGVWLEFGGAIENQIIGTGSWSADILRQSEYFLPAAPVIIEIGANIGFESLYYARKFPDARVIAFEPGSYGYNSLLRSRSFNRLQNLEVHRLGVGSENTKMLLRTPTQHSKNKGLGSFQNNVDIDDTYVSEEVNVVTLDSFLLDLSKLDLLKVDTQGFEWPVLQGAERIISTYRPVIIFEFEDHYHNEAHELRKTIANFFERLNYSLFIADNDNLKPADFANERHVHADIFALPNPT